MKFNNFNHNKRILHITVNYNQDAETVSFINSCLLLENAQYVQFCVVDNSNLMRSDKESKISFLLPSHIDYLTPKQNLGYFGAAQFAVEYYFSLFNVENKQSDVPPTYIPEFISKLFDWVIVSNTDLKILNNNFYSNLVNFHLTANSINTINNSTDSNESNESIDSNDFNVSTDINVFTYPELSSLGVIAPQIISEISQRDSNPFLVKRPSRFKMYFLKVVFSNYITCQMYQILAYLKEFLKRINFGVIFKNIISKSNPDNSSNSHVTNLSAVNNSLKTQRFTNYFEINNKIYAPHGAFMIFSKNYFFNGLDFSHCAFLYGEEVATGEKLLSKKLFAIYRPDFKVLHKEHGSTGLMSYFFSPNTFRFKKESSHNVYEKYFKIK